MKVEGNALEPEEKRKGEAREEDPWAESQDEQEAVGSQEGISQV